MSFPYQNPINAQLLPSPYSVPKTSVQGTNFSVLGIGGWIEVGNISDLALNFSGVGLQQLTGNTVPINLYIGNGTPFNPTYVSLNSDNFSSGRRRLGMVAYVQETNLAYQFQIDNYESLWNAATASTNTVSFNLYDTQVKNNSVAGQNFIDAWTASTVEGISGVTRANARWRLLITGGTVGSGGTSNYYANFSDTTNQPVTAANTPTVWSANTTEISNGIYLQDGSKITVSNDGIYEIGYSGQIEKTQGGTSTDVTIWAKINGNNVDRSSSTISLVSNSAYQLPFVSYIFELYAGDYVEFYFSAPSQYVQLTTLSGLTSPTRPVSPSLILLAKAIGSATLSTSGDSYVTGFTLTNDNLILSQNRIGTYSGFTVNLPYLNTSGGTINGNLTVTGSTSATTYYGDGSNLTGISRGGGGGAGGQLYYFNISNTQSPYYEFSTTATTVTEQTLSATTGSTQTAYIGGFMTPNNLPNITNFPAGILSFYLHSYTSNASATFEIYCELYKRTTGGTETLLFTSDPSIVVGTTTTMYITDGFFSGATLNSTDRLVVKLYATNTSNQTRTIYFISEGSQHYSFSLTTIPSFTDTYVTGFTYSANTFTIKQNNNQSDLSQTINQMTGLTINGNLTVTGSTNLLSGLTVTGSVTNQLSGIRLITSDALGSGTVLLHALAGSATTTSSNYFIRADNDSTYLNAQSSTGNTFIRVGNATIANVSSTGVTANALTVSGSTVLNSLLTTYNTSSMDGGILGSELLSSTGWTSAGWTGSYAAGFTHTTGNTSTLSNTLAAVAGSYYQFNITITGTTSGTVTIKFGGASVDTISTSTNKARGIRAISTSGLTVEPTNDFNGTVILSLKLVTAGTSAIQMYNSAGTLTNEIRTFTSNTNNSIGFQAGQRITSGLGNTFIGFNSGANTMTPDGNVGIGYITLQSNTLGTLNTAIGYAALNSNTIGNSNMAIGFSCLSNNTSASDNIGIGYACMSNLTGGSRNVANGTNSGRYISNGLSAFSSDNSIFIGFEAGPSGNSQTNQIVIGYQTSGLGSNTTVLGNSSTTATTIYGSLGLGVLSATNRLHVSASTDPVRFVGLNSASDTTLLTVDATGVLHTIPKTGVSINWYAENKTYPSSVPIASGASSVAFGSGARALAAEMFVFGDNAGVNATGATYSVFIGERAGSGATNADSSLLVGYEAGWGNTGGTDSVCIGYQSGRLLTGGTNNLLGNQSGRAADAGWVNYLGYQAGFTAKDGTYGNYFGYQAGYNINNGRHSTLIGYQTGFQSVNNQSSICIGPNAGRNYTGTTVGTNVMIGSSSGNNARNCEDSIGIGESSLQSSVTSSLNINIGTSSGFQQTGSTTNVCIGYKSNQQSLTNNSNVIIGHTAGASSSLCLGSIFLGYFAGNQANNCDYSTFIGYNSGYQAKATDSIFIGRSSGYQTTGSSNSIFIGYAAGSNATLADTTIFMGFRAGLSATSADDSVFIGYDAGRENTSATKSVFLGYGAGSSSGGTNLLGTNNIIIGTNVTLSSSTSNSMNIGGVLFGTGLNSTANTVPITTPTTNGRIGIRRVTPRVTLDVSGDTIIDGGLTATTISGTSITLSSSASTINLTNTSQQQIRFFSGGTGTPTLTNYSAGAKIILNDNIDSSISTGFAIGVDTGILWYGADLTGNGHEWYAGTRKLSRLVTSDGYQLLGLGGPTTAAMTISGTSSLGSKGGLGYMDFLRVYNNYPSATNPNKWFRTTSGGTLEILRDDYSAVTFSLTDGGIMSVGGGNAASVTSNDATTNYLSFNNNGTQIYDDGNTHIHSRNVGGTLWINSNGGGINIGTQSPTSTGSIATSINCGTGTVTGYFNINTGRTFTDSSSYGYLTNQTSPNTTGYYVGGSQSVTVSLYAVNRIWGQEIDAFSDERMKDIQGEVTLDDGLKLVNKLKPIKYTWKNGEDKGLKVGYSAQQVSKSGFDHLVALMPREGLEETIDDDGFVSPKDTQFSMNYDQVVPYHGVVIKHLLDKIEQLEKELENIKNNR